MSNFLRAGLLAATLMLGSCGILHDVRPDLMMRETPMIQGNRVTLLFDGPQTMASMSEAIRAAKSHIHLETYIFEQDHVGESFATLLKDRQRAGVQVRVIYDAVGTLGTPQQFFEEMRATGVQLLAFNPVNPFKLKGPWKPNRRDHRKILVVDGAVAFTGGVNISSTYSSRSPFRSKSKRSGMGAVGWRDTHIKLEGPAVAELQRAFLSTWHTMRPVESTQGIFFPLLMPMGNKAVKVLTSEPDGDQDIYRAHILAIRAAQKSIHMTSAYFVPDPQLLSALCDAAQRHVDVKLILPGVLEGGMVFFAGHSFYSDMLACGIRIHQMQIAVLHAKTAVIDRHWSTVGSTNMDTRSFLHNSELNVIVLDDGFASAMEKAFDDDLVNTREMTAATWDRRSNLDRIKEWAARQFEYWL